MNNFVVEAKGPVQVDIQDAPDLSLSDMLEIAAMGGNGVEYININNLMEKAATRIRELETQIADMRLQAQSWAAEAKTQRATVHEALQAASGATGEKGDWNGAKPIKEALAAAEAAGVAKGLEASPDDLRALGLMVAVHNDYRLNGETHTFWLMTRKDGMSFKGEGKTDAEALNQIRTLSPSPGMVLVPREPSEAMLNAAADATDGQFEIDGDKGAWLPSSGFGAAYRAMIGAARE